MEVSKVNKKYISKLSKLLNGGAIVVCPTDTVYGLICDATNKKAVQRLYKIKKRNLNNPVPIFVKNLKVAKQLAFINKEQEKILKKVWPGKTTIVLNRKKGKKLYGVDKKTIALRIPDYKLINQLPGILTGTSANISGKPASTKIAEVISQFKNQKLKPDAIIDAGNLKPSKPSKIIDLTGEEAKVLRR